MTEFLGRIRFRIAALGAVFLFLMLALLWHEMFAETPYIARSFRQIPWPTTSDKEQPKRPTTQPSTITEATPAASPTNTYPGDPELLANVTKYIPAIMNPDDKTFERLACPRFNSKRYDYLKPPSAQKPTYLFALNYREKVALLPRLMGSIVEVMRFLGPEHCVLSVVEGNSNDGSFEVLKLLQVEVEGLGARYHFLRSDINPKDGDRIAALAELRNLALEPLIGDPAAFATDAMVVFLNDVAICAEDILELVHQEHFLGADMVCAIDWVYVGQDPTFYDVWVARTIQGDSFFEIPPDGNWNSAWNLFWNAPADQERFRAHKPFQVFSCWNGAVVFRARPLWDENIRFRTRMGEECVQGEPQLFCKDLWRAGHGKIAAVPSVHLGYDDEAGAKLKALKGYASQWVEDKADESWKIVWKEEPPEKVKCMPNYANQVWRPWDEGFSNAE